MNAFEQRRRERTVPPDATGARAFEYHERPIASLDEDAQVFVAGETRIPVNGRGIRTVADLQARLREDGAL